jgi:hypothetical protein
LVEPQRGLAQAGFPKGALALFRPWGVGWDFLGVVTAGKLIATAPLR